MCGKEVVCSSVVSWGKYVEKNICLQQQQQQQQKDRSTTQGSSETLSQVSNALVFFSKGLPSFAIYLIKLKFSLLNLHRSNQDHFSYQQKELKRGKQI